MAERHTKVIVTLGPSTADERSLRRLKGKSVDFVRTNMSHSSIADLQRSVSLARKVGIPFVLDTEGSQVRTGELEEEVICFQENTEVRVWGRPVVGNMRELCLRPGSVVDQLKEGDLIHIDFDTLILRISDTSTARDGYVKTSVITGGFVGRNKAVVIDPVVAKRFDLPPLSEKDFQSIELGLAEGVQYIAMSFARSGFAVEEVRRVTKGTMRIISKIECIDALENLDDIIDASDFLLIDRGDLSKEIPVERIPFTQKLIINKASKRGKGVFVATNLLETMIEKRKPTRAEIHDVINTISDGAAGLTLAAETAIGKYPMECVNMLNRLIQHTEAVVRSNKASGRTHPLIAKLEASNYLLDLSASSCLVEPHGGKLVSRVLLDRPDGRYLDSLRKVKLDERHQLEVEQIALGIYSPIEGFLGRVDFESVLEKMRLADGTVWPMPIVLDVSEEIAQTLVVGDDVGLIGANAEVVSILHLEEKYRLDREKLSRRMDATRSAKHLGVHTTRTMNPILLAGKIDLVRERDSAIREYELSPRQVRRLFEERGWSSVLGFPARNVIHGGHECIHLNAVDREDCDGLFVHPAVAEKKSGGFNTNAVFKNYAKMVERFYPRNRVVLAAFSTFSRCAGPREALFAALCRKNFGCSHCIVRRDHIAVSNDYDPTAWRRIFDEFPDLGIKVVEFDEIFYSTTFGAQAHKREDDPSKERGKLSIREQKVGRGASVPAA